MAHPPGCSQFEFEHFNGIPLDLPQKTPTNTSFLFVVKTPDSGVLSRSTSRIAAASINSHAQRWAQDIGGSKGAQPLHTNKTTSGVHADLRFENCVNRCRIDRLGVSDTKVTKSRRPALASKSKSKSKSSKKRIANVPSAVPSEAPTTISSNNSKPETTSATSHQDQRPSRRELNPTLPTPSNPLPLPLAVFSGPTASALDYIRVPSLSLDSNIQSVLQYYLSFVLLSAPDDGPHSTHPQDTQLVQHSSTIKAIVQGCLRESVHLYALLAATASRMKRVSGIHFAPDHGPESYLSKAIQGLRALLTVQMASTDRQLILDIYYLSVCEWYLGSYDAACTHSNFLKQLLRALPPGTSEFDQYVHDMLCYDNTWLSLGASSRTDQGSKPSSLVSYYQSSPRDHRVWDLEDEQDASDRCSALRSALQGPTYSQDLRDLVRDLPPVLNLFQHFNAHKLDEVDDAFVGANPLASSCAELTRRILEKPSYGNELCCRLALILNLRSIARAATPATRTGTTSPSTSTSDSTDTDRETILTIQRLRRQLQYEILLPSNEISRSSSVSLARHSTPSSSSSPPPSSGSSPTAPSTNPCSKIWTGASDELLLWILVTGVSAARRAHLTDEAHWFRTRATALMDLLDITTQAQLEQLMGSFFAADGMDAVC